MNKQGQVGLSLLLVVFLVAIVLFAMIDPLKESLDSVRNSSGLNCPDVSGHNSTSYTQQTTLEKLTYRPTCFVMGLSMVWFVGAVLLAAVMWLVKGWIA